MSLPININELLNGKTVEWERIEFREGWNPERTLRTICAFANDFNNWGGGYIILGIAEKNGQSILPPSGLKLNQIEVIQQELNQICRRILPNYFPIVEPVHHQNKNILILWCSGGSNRPYKAPVSLSKTPNYFYFIRRYSSTVQPTRDEERELLSMANQVPFDDQVNHRANLNNLDLSKIRAYLNDVKSDLENELPNLSIKEITRRMNIAEGSNEILLPKNVGILLFSKNPHQFFPYAKIEIVNFSDDAGTDFTEKIFEGPIHQQLKDSLNYLKNVIVTEKVIKQSGKAESLRFYNYPYQAIEEALSNAVYHRGYDNDSPIEIRIYPSRIDIISFPGPLPPLDRDKLQKLQLDVRKYRNRRIGEFLKELHLTEGRSTGIPTILREMKKNGSPKPIFETDENRTYFKTSLYIHPAFTVSVESVQISVQVREQANFFIINNLEEILDAYTQVGEQVREQVRNQLKTLVKEEKIINLVNVLSLSLEPKTRYEVLNSFGLTNIYKNYESHIAVLLDNGIMQRTIPDKPRSPKQKYRTTEKGKQLLKLIKDN